MSETADDDPRITPMPDALDSPDDIVLTSRNTWTFHLPKGDGETSVCGHNGRFTRRPRNTLPHHKPCANCFDDAEPGDGR